MMDVEHSDTSSEASYFEQEPISGAVLLDQELLHREGCEARGNILTGCHELDNHVLLGGLARGRVVGLSAEGETFGLLLGLQTIARLLVSGKEDAAASQPPAAMIITTLSHAELLPTLRSVVKGQVEALPGSSNANGRIKAALERISISRVFDFDGLREALDELDRPGETGPPGTPAQIPAEEPEHAFAKPHWSPRHQAEPEIRDSEDEDEASSLSSPSSIQQPSPPNRPQEPRSHHLPSLLPVQPQHHYPTPDIVLITNITALITSLYTTHDRRLAHRMLRHLSSSLRYLSRSPAHAGPLFILLNSTTSKPPSSKPPKDQQQVQQQQQDQHLPSSALSTPHSQSSTSASPPHSPSDQQPLPGQQDPSLRQSREREESHSAIRSVFNPAPPDPGEEMGEVDEYGYARHPNPDFDLLARLSRRNKPFFGLRFGGMVDVHLLATRVPRTDGDAEVYFGGLGKDGAGEMVSEGVGLVWVVEVLCDGVGVWVEDPEGDEMEMDEGGRGEGARMGRRFNREQRWAGVEVKDGRGGVRVVGAGTV